MTSLFLGKVLSEVPFGFTPTLQMPYRTATIYGSVHQVVFSPLRVRVNIQSGCGATGVVVRCRLLLTSHGVLLTSSSVDLKEKNAVVVWKTWRFVFV